MTYTHIKRTLLLVSCIMGLSSSVLQAKYISGLTGATGVSSFAKRVTVDGIINSTKLVTLSGSVPDSTASTSNMMINGFADIVVGRLTASSGAVDATFNTNGYIVLDEQNIKAANVALFDTGDVFIPGAIISDGTDYYVFGSGRYADASESTSKLFVTKILANGAIDTSFNESSGGAANGGSANLTAAGISGAYDGGQTPLYIIHAAAYDSINDDLAIIAGSIMEDPEDSSSYKSKGFLAVIDLTDGSVLEVQILSGTGGTNFLELFNVILDTAGTSVYACGYDGDDAIVTKYTYDFNGPTYLALVTAFGNDGSEGTDNDGRYNYNPTGTTPAGKAKAWDIKELSGGTIVVAVAESVDTLDPLIQAVTVLRLTTAGALDTAFSTADGIQTYTFSGIPSAYPHDFSLNYPSFSFENTHLTLQIGDSDTIFLCGSLSAYGMPFVYKLDADGVEQPFAPNFRYGIDTGNLTSAVLDPSPVLYPVMGYSWDTALQGVFASAINNTTDQLYLFGTSGNVQRSTSDDAFTLNSASDTVQQVPTGNLDLLTETNYPILRTGSYNVVLTNVYSAAAGTISLNTAAEPGTVTGEVGGEFDNTTLVLVIDAESINANATESLPVYGSVDINGVTIPLYGSYSVTMAGNGTIASASGTVRGAYSGGLVSITLGQDTHAQSLSQDITASASINLSNTYDPIASTYSISIEVSALNITDEAPASYAVSALYLNTLEITTTDADHGDTSINVNVYGQVTVDPTGVAPTETVALTGTLTVTIANLKLAAGSLAGDATSQVTGYLSSGEQITITLDDATETNTRADLTIVGTAVLAFDNDATVGTSAAITVDTGDMTPTSTTSNVEFDSITLTDISQTFTQRGQHKVFVTGTLQYDLTNSNELNQTVTVSGYMPITVLQNYNVTAEPFKMTGTSGTSEFTLWVKTITVTNS